MLTTAGNSLRHLFKALHRHSSSLKCVRSILLSKNPLVILLEGSSYLHNIDELDTLISKRSNPKDTVVLIDIDPAVVSEHNAYIRTRFPHKKYFAIHADMNKLPHFDSSIDLVLHNFTVNFNRTRRDDAKTLSEIKRVLKPKTSACLFSVAVSLDAKKHIVSLPVGQAVLKHQENYYEELFCNYSFRFTEFDRAKKTSRIAFRRYVLTPL